jgi:hypothetical protein
MTVRDIRAELRRAESMVRRLRKQLRKSKQERLGHTKRRGMGCRDRDEDLKRQRGYTNSSSYVRRDGSEKLVGEDWKRRTEELRQRSGGLCEIVIGEGAGKAIPGIVGTACVNAARDPHHVIRRSVRRDDRLTNLIDICGPHHDMLDPRKPKWTKP